MRSKRRPSTNGPIGEVDARGLGQNPDNLTAINALKIQRSFRFGKNVDMILTDNRSYQSAPIMAKVCRVFDFGAYA